jgi:hypothetical protein
LRFRVAVEFELDRSSPHIYTDDETGVSSVEELIQLLFAEEDIEAEEIEVEAI